MPLPPEDVPQSAVDKAPATMGEQEIDGLPAPEGVALRKRRLKGLLLAVVGTALMATNFVTIKYALRGIKPLPFVVIWFGAVSIYGGIYAALWRPPWGVQLRRNFRPIAAAALLTPLAAIPFWFAMQWLDPTVAAFLILSGTVYSILLGYLFLGERFTLWSASGMFLVLGGIALMTYHSGRAELVGMVLILGGCLVGSLSYMFGKMAIETTDPALIEVSRGVATAAVGLLLAAVFGQIHSDFAWHYLAVALLGAFFGELLAQTVLFYALRFVGLSEQAVIAATTPLMVGIYSLVFLGVLPSLRQNLSGLVVIAGVLLLARARSVEHAKHTAVPARKR